MTQAPAAIFKIPTKSPQRARGPVSRALRVVAAKPKAASLVAGLGIRAATRGDGEVIELELGITVYPPRDDGGRWRAAWYEDGAEAVRVGLRGEARREAGEGQAADRHGRVEHDQARRGPDRLVPQPGPASR